MDRKSIISWLHFIAIDNKGLMNKGVDWIVSQNDMVKWLQLNVTYRIYLHLCEARVWSKLLTSLPLKIVLKRKLLLWRKLFKSKKNLRFKTLILLSFDFNKVVWVTHARVSSIVVRLNFFIYDGQEKKTVVMKKSIQKAGNNPSNEINTSM